MTNTHDDRIAAVTFALVAGLALVVLAVWCGVQAYMVSATFTQAGYVFGAFVVCGAAEGCLQAAWDFARRPTETALPGPKAV